MIEIGYAVSSEEHSPSASVKHAERAEEIGFSFIGVSDHFHPWIDRQGHSPFVWSLLGAMAQATERIRIGTGVTCPIQRIHPAIIAQAAATTACLMPGRFFLGVGTGEALNEHILGLRWPPSDIRRDMLEEAVEVIRLLWQGGSQTHRGEHYTVENARIYDLPEQLPEIIVAGSGTKAAEFAARIGDGFWSTSPDSELIETFKNAGGRGMRLGQLTVCFAEDEAEARRTAHEWWPNTSIPGQLSQDLPTPKHFEQAAQNVTEDMVADVVICGPDVGRYTERITEYADAGFDHIYLHQIGEDQEAFFRFAETELLPALHDRELVAVDVRS